MNPKLMARSIIMIFCQLLFTIAAIANSEDNIGHLKGLVTTSEGRPAAAVTVQLKGTKKSTITAEDGTFTISNIPVGSYEVEISLVGYETTTQAVTVENKQTKNIALQLQVSEKQLQEVVVSSGRNKFNKKETEYVSRMPLSNLENPQVYTSVSAQLLQEQGASDFKSAFKNIPGVSSNGANHSANGRYYNVVRGFNTANAVRNGLAATSVTEIDPVNMDRLEAIKGPSGTLYGASLSSFGGVLNRVTKKAFDYFKGEVAWTAGSWGLNRLTADVNTPINKENTLLLRMNAAVHTERSFQDHGYFKTFTFAPTLTYKPTEKLTIHIDAEFYNRKGTAVFGNSFRNITNVTARSADQLKLEYNKSYNNNSILANTQAANFYGQINYKLSEKWLSQTNLGYASCQFEYPAVNVVTINDTLLERRIRYQFTNQLNTQIQQNFIGDFYIAGFRNRVVAGIDAQIGKFDFPNTKDFAYDSLNYINPGVKYAALNLDDVKQKLAGKTNVGSRSASYAVGAYISDVFNITSNLEVMASIRWDKYKNEGNYSYTTNITGGIFDQSAISPKFGIVYQPVKGVVSLFANYMNGFQFVTGQDINGNSFKPQYANQSEAGVKAEAFSGKLSVTASVYDISVTNTTRTDPTNSAYSIQDGTQKSKGIEVEVIANPVSGLNIVAGYSYNDSKLSQANKDVVGKRPAGSGAYNVANGWISYRVPAGKWKGWGIGAGANYSGDQYFLNNTTARFIIPEYTVLDATLFYDNKDFRIGVKADNLTSEKYWAQSTLAPQAPLRISATITVKFK